MFFQPTVTTPHTASRPPSTTRGTPMMNRKGLWKTQEFQYIRRRRTLIPITAQKRPPRSADAARNHGPAVATIAYLGRRPTRRLPPTARLG